MTVTFSVIASAMNLSALLVRFLQYYYTTNNTRTGVIIYGSVALRGMLGALLHPGPQFLEGGAIGGSGKFLCAVYN